MPQPNKKALIQVSVAGADKAIGEIKMIGSSFDSAAKQAKIALASIEKTMQDLARTASALSKQKLFDSRKATTDLRQLQIELNKLEKTYKSLLNGKFADTAEKRLLQLEKRIDALMQKANKAGVKVPCPEPCPPPDAQANGGNGGGELPPLNFMAKLGIAGAAIAGLKVAFDGVSAAASSAYSLIIAKNEQMRQQVLQSATVLAGAVQVSYGGAVLGVTDSIRALTPELEKLQKNVEERTAALAGVTSEQTKEVLAQVLQNFSALQGQTKGFTNDLQAAEEIAVALTAGFGTFQIPTEQYAQEVRAILQGDVNNPDARLAKSLNLQKIAFDKAVGAGEKAKFILDALKPSLEGNAIAADTLTNSFSVFSDAISVLLQDIGRPFLDPLTESLGELAKTFSPDALAPIRQATTDIFEPIAELFVNLGLIISDLIGSWLIPLSEVIVKNLYSALKGLIEFLVLPAKAMKELTKFVGDATRSFFAFAKAQDKANAIAGEQDWLPDSLVEHFNLIQAIIDGYKQVASLIPAILPGQEFGSNAIDLEDEALEEGRAKIQKYSEEFYRNKQILLQLEKESNGELTKENKKYLAGLLTAQKDAIAADIEAARNRADTGFESQRKQREQEIANLEAEIARLEALAGEKGITLGVGTDVKPIKNLGKVGDALREELKGLYQKATTEGAGGVPEELEKTSALLLEKNKEALEAGAINGDEYRKGLNKILQDERLSAKLRIQAQQELTDSLGGLYDRRIKLIEAESKAIAAAAAQGKLTAGEAQIAQQEASIRIAKQEQAKLVTELQSLKKQAELNNTELRPSLLDDYLAKIQSKNAEIAEQTASLYDSKLKEATTKFELATTKASRIVQLEADKRKLILEQETQAGVKSVEDLAIARIKEEQRATRIALQEAEKRLAFLLAQPQAKSLAARDERENQIFATRQAIQNTLIQGLQQEGRLREAILAAEFKQLDIAESYRKIAIDAEISRLSLVNERAGLEEQNLQRQLELVQMQSDLVLKGIDLASARLDAKIARQEQALSLADLLQNESTGEREKAEARRQLLAQGFNLSIGYESALLAIADNRFNLQQQQAQKEVEAMNLRMRLEQDSLNIQFELTRLANQRMQIEAQVALIQQEASGKLLEAELIKANARRDAKIEAAEKVGKVADTSAEDAELAGLQGQLSSNKELIDLRDKQLDIANQQIAEEEGLNKLRRDALDLEQQITKEKQEQGRAVKKDQQALEKARLQDKADKPISNAPIQPRGNVRISGLPGLTFDSAADAFDYLAEQQGGKVVKKLSRGIKSYIESSGNAQPHIFEPVQIREQNETIINNYPNNANSRSTLRLAGL